MTPQAPCQHDALIDQLIQLEQSEQYETLLAVALQSLTSLELRGDIDSLRASIQVRFMAMRALAVTGRQSDSLNFSEETEQRYHGQEDEAILFWLNSSLIASADLYWQTGKRDTAVKVLETCAAKLIPRGHPALRMLGLRAAIDLSICDYESGQRDTAIAKLTRLIEGHIQDLELNVNEELCRAVKQRYQFLCARA